jgi:excisionase family DNA binding protein
MHCDLRGTAHMHNRVMPALLESREDTHSAPAPHCTTLEAARRLGMAVRSVQLMVDRGDLDAWKTPGGHRRISEESLQRWLAKRRVPGSSDAAAATPGRPPTRAPLLVDPAQPAAPRVLLIEDSVHYQNLVALLITQRFAGVELHVADDGLAGLVMYGRLLPQVLIIDILLPGIDGATLITSLRSHAQFAGSELIVMTSLSEAEREPYAFALGDVPVVHKPRLVADLPGLIERSLAARQRAGIA